MAGLSSIMAITRPLGEVSQAAMSRCVGVYRVYIVGGGGGGGGYDDFYQWYGGAGGNGQVTTYTGQMFPPSNFLTLGYAGKAGVGAGEMGEGGSQAEMYSRRSVNFTAQGGAGGFSAYSRKLYEMDYSEPRIGKETDRFTISFFSTYPSSPYFVVTKGQGGRSNYPGSTGGLIKAFRIG